MNADLYFELYAEKCEDNLDLSHQVELLTNENQELKKQIAYLENLLDDYRYGE